MIGNLDKTQLDWYFKRRFRYCFRNILAFRRHILNCYFASYEVKQWFLDCAVPTGVSYVSFLSIFYLCFCFSLSNFSQFLFVIKCLNRNFIIQCPTWSLKSTSWVNHGWLCRRIYLSLYRSSSRSSFIYSRALMMAISVYLPGLNT